jgi:hypothetical protein
MHAVPEVYTPSRPQQTQQQQKEMLQEHDAAETAASAVGSRRSDLLACCISSGCDSSTASELLAALYFSDYEAIQDLLVEPAGKLGLVALLSSSYHDVQQAAADAVAILGKQVSWSAVVVWCSIAVVASHIPAPGTLDSRARSVWMLTCVYCSTLLNSSQLSGGAPAAG